MPGSFTYVSRPTTTVDTKGSLRVVVQRRLARRSLLLHDRECAQMACRANRNAGFRQRVALIIRREAGLLGAQRKSDGWEERWNAKRDRSE